MIPEEQLLEYREFADHMGSDISVLSIQYRLAKMVWTLVDEVTDLRRQVADLEELLRREEARG